MENMEQLCIFVENMEQLVCSPCSKKLEIVDVSSCTAAPGPNAVIWVPACRACQTVSRVCRLDSAVRSYRAVLCFPSFLFHQCSSLIVTDW